jgi:hypothetical protein
MPVTVGFEGVKRVNFQTASATADWNMPYTLLVPEIDGWDQDVEVVVLGLSPDFVEWNDYGIRQRSFPMSDAPQAPFFQASSDDGSGVVMLLDPNEISIVVPFNVIQQLGPGAVNVGIQYRTKDTGSRATLLIGRLPLVWGVI